MTQKQIPVNLDPNLRGLSNVSLQGDELHFIMLTVTGNTAQQYLLSPSHAKRAYLLFKKNIEAYEKQFGEIKTALPEEKQNETSAKEVGFKQA